MVIQRFSFPSESHVSSGEYDPGDPEKGEKTVLTIQYKKGGGIGCWKGVPAEIVGRLRESPNPGKILHAEVYGKYEYTKLA